MLLVVDAGNEDVIQVYKSTVQSPQGLVHQPLEGLGRVLEAKRHPQELKETKRCDDRGLGDVGLVDGDAVKPPGKVNDTFLPLRRALKS